MTARADRNPRPTIGRGSDRTRPAPLGVFLLAALLCAPRGLAGASTGAVPQTVLASVARGDSGFLAVQNVGDRPIRDLVFTCEPDLTPHDLNATLRALQQTGPSVTDPREELRALVRVAWESLTKRVAHYCSPGRRGTFVIDPLSQIFGYGVGCCSHVNRALATILAHIGLRVRFVTTPRHEYLEYNDGTMWSIIDASLGLWFPGVSHTDTPEFFRRADATSIRERAIAVSEGGPARDPQWLETTYFDGIRSVLPWERHSANQLRPLVLHTNERVASALGRSAQGLVHAAAELMPPMPPPQVAPMRYHARYEPGDGRLTFGAAGDVFISAELPFPIVSFDLHLPRDRAAGRFALLWDGQRRHVGRVRGDHWIVTRVDLEPFSIDGAVTIVGPRFSGTLEIEWTLQSTLACGASAPAVHVVDSRPACRKSLAIASRLRSQRIRLGNLDCDALPRVVDHPLADAASRPIVRAMRGAVWGAWGIVLPHGVRRTEVVLQWPAGTGPTRLVKVHGSRPLKWFARGEEGWRRVPARRVGKYQWLSICSESGPDGRTTIVGVARRRDAGRDEVLLDYVSYEEADDLEHGPFLGMRCAGEGARGRS